jgi:hypothetical protein
MEGRELTARERGKLGLVDQADSDDYVDRISLPGRPPSGKRHTFMRLKFMALSSRIGSAFGVKLKNQVPSSSFGQTKMGCRITRDKTLTKGRMT